MTRRRTVLQAIPITLLSGCTEQSIKSPKTSPEKTTTMNNDPAKEITLKQIENKDLGNLQIEAQILAEMTNESPAILEISAINTSNQERRFVFGPIPPFSSIWPEHKTSDASLLLMPISKQKYVHSECETVIPDKPDNCWQAHCQVLVNPAGTSKKIDSNDDISTEYAILQPSASSSCFQTGTYKTTQKYQEDGSCSIEIDVI